MNATIMKGERSKLLAVAVVMAMVACALVAFMPTADAADVSETKPATELPTAVDGIITLDNDVELSEKLMLSENVTIDLAGYDISVPGINITAEVTINGAGTITKSSGNAASSAIEVDNGGVLVMNDGNIDASNGGWYGVYAMTGSSVELNDTTISAMYSCVSGNGTQNNAVVELNDVTCVSEMTAAVFFPSTNALTVTGGTFTGTTGFDIRAGIVTIENATINIDLTNPDWTGTSGPSAFGMGVAVFDHSSYGDNIEVTVSGCTINNAVYDYYVGGLNLAAGNAAMDSSTAGVGPEGFDGSKLGEKYTYNDTITLDIPGYSFSSECGYQFIANDVDGTSFTVPAGIVVDGTVSFEEGISVTISNVKAAGEDGLTISQGSVVLTGEMTAAEAAEQIQIGIAAGETEIELGDLTVTEGTLALDGTVNIVGDVTVSENAGLDLTNATITSTSDASIVSKGTITGADKLPESINVENTGITYSADGKTAEVGSASALTTALNNTDVTKIVMTADIVYSDSLFGRTAVTLDLNGNDLAADGAVNLGNLTLNVPAGSKLTLNGNSFNLSEDKLVTAAGSVFVKGDGARLFTDRPDPVPAVGSATTEIAYPILADGAIVEFEGSQFTIYHQKSGNITIQYGITMDGVYYTGSPITMFDISLHAEVFDVQFRDITNQTYDIDSRYIDSETGLSTIVDAREDPYVGAVNVQITFSNSDGSGAITFNQKLDLTVNPVDSELVFGEYAEDSVYDVPVDQIIDTDGYQVSVDGTNVTVTGTLLYYDGNGWAANTWPDDEKEGYYLLMSIDWMQSNVVYDLAETVFTFNGKEYTATTFDNFMLVYLGTEPALESIKSTVDYDGEGTNFAETEYTIDLAGISLMTQIDFEAASEETVYGVDVDRLVTGVGVTDTANGATITAGVYYYKGAWTGAGWPETEDEGYYLVIDITNPTGSWVDASFKINGEEIATQPFDGYLVMFLGTSAAEFPETITVTADLDGEGTKYTEGTAVATLELTAFPSIVFGVIESTDSFDIGGVTIDQLQKDVGVTVVKTETENTFKVAFTGELSWMHGYTWYNSADVKEQKGYYLGFKIETPAGWQNATVQTYLPDGETVKKTFNSDGTVFDGFFVWKVDSDSQADKIVITIDEVTYTYLLDFSELDLIEVGGYIDNGQPAGSGVPESILGFEPTDVIGETMYMIFNSAAAEDMVLELYDPSGKLVYVENWADVSNGTHMWYFSFIDGVLKYQQAQGNEDYKPAAGEYTMVAKINGDDVATATAICPGTLGFNYNESADKVIEDLENLGYDTSGLVDGTATGVAPETMWILWYNYAFTGEAVATLTWTDGTSEPVTIFTETDSGNVWNTANMHLWYFSFDSDNYSWIGKDSNTYWPDEWSVENGYDGIVPGTYTMTVYYLDNDKKVILAEGEKTIVDEDAYSVFINDEGENYDYYLDFRTGDMFYLPGTNVDGKVVKYWELVVDGEVVNTFEEGGLVVFGQIMDAKKELVTSNNLEFRAVVVDETTGGETGGNTPDFDQRTQYTVGGTLEGEVLTVDVDSEQTGSEYINLIGGAFYYEISVQVGDNVYYIQNVIASKIIAGYPGYKDVQTINIIDALAQNHIRVTADDIDYIFITFSYDYGLNTYSADSTTIVVEHAQEQPIVGIVDDADQAEAQIAEALESFGRTDNVPTDIAPETVFAVFEADSGEYVMTLQNADEEVVYQETVEFENGGAHVWYFSLAEGQPSWNPETVGVDVALTEGAIVDGETYSLLMDGTIIGQITA